jgi:hypothetical protein
VAQVVKHLPSKHKVMSSSPSTIKKQQQQPLREQSLYLPLLFFIFKKMSYCCAGGYIVAFKVLAICQIHILFLETGSP